MSVRLLKKKRTCLCALAVTTLLSASSQASASSPGDFTQLVELSTKRLYVAREVALFKWDNKQAVEDKAREAVVIKTSVEEASAKGLYADFVARFFSDQIEANKVVQYALLAKWTQDGQAPDEPRASLENSIRPELDLLQTEFVDQLIDNPEGS
jgi:chorismate mutase